MAGTWTTYLLRYGEIGVKSPQVRRRFVQQLVDNLETHFERRKATCLVDTSWGRIWLEARDDEVAHDVISRTFGLVSGSPTLVVDATLEAIGDQIEAIAPDHVSPGDSFAIRARRAGSHPFTSQDVGVTGGDAVGRAVDDITVDLDDPDVEIFVEVRDEAAYIFTEIIDGPGGLPMGSQGTIVVPFLGPRSPAAAWLVMRRGADVHALVPDGCQDVVATLEPWAPGMAYTLLPDPVTRKGLLAAADQLAHAIDANSLALDDHETRALTDPGLDTPLLRPLAGLPGKRWPEGAYRVSKQAAKEHPATCVDEGGLGPEDAVAALDGAERSQL